MIYFNCYLLQYLLHSTLNHLHWKVLIEMHCALAAIIKCDALTGRFKTVSNTGKSKKMWKKVFQQSKCFLLLSRLVDLMSVYLSWNSLRWLLEMSVLYFCGTIVLGF